MDELKTLLIRDACQQLLMRYAIAVDSQDIDAFVSLFAEEFVWKRPGKGDMTSRGELREFFRQIWAKYAEMPHGVVKRHNFTTMCIEPIDEETAKSVAYSIVLTDSKFCGTSPSPMSLPEFGMEYHHVFKKTLEGWKIAYHEGRFVFSSGGQIPSNIPKLHG